MRRLLALLATATLLSVAVGLGPVTPASAGSAPTAPFNQYWSPQPITVGGDYQPLVGANGCLTDSGFVLWYAPGSAPDYLWTFSDVAPFTYSVLPRPVNGTYEPLVGDFDDDGCDDIFWYAPGTAADAIWFNDGDGTFTAQPITVDGTYRPIVVELDGDGGDDILWYAPGPGAESQWRGRPDRAFDKSAAPNVNGTFRVAAFEDIILFHAPGSAPDYIWNGLAPGAAAPDQDEQVIINGTYEPVAVASGFILYAPGPAGDHFVYGPGSGGVLQTVAGTINGTYTTSIASPALRQFPVWHAPGPGGDFFWAPAGVSRSNYGWAREAPQASFTMRADG